ncbi:hypothetical protein AZ54_18100 [Xanthomonas oryzae pv. oryzae PXO86]|nr:hypothetical protein AZ54_18100 [Xanthomonas oryzae pv. oryzae PXO86]
MDTSRRRGLLETFGERCAIGWVGSIVEALIEDQMRGL